MKWTNQRKAAVAIMVVAVGAFAVDRFVLGYESVDLSGDLAPAVESAAIVQKVEPRAAAIVHSGGPSVADRVDALGASLAPMPQTGDAFTVPPAWLKLVQKAAPETVEQPKLAETPAIPEFRLSMIVGSNARGNAAAVINSRTVRVGQSISGFKLVQVTPALPPQNGQPGRPGSVVLQGPTGNVVVPMTDPGSSTATAAATDGES